MTVASNTSKPSGRLGSSRGPFNNRTWKFLKCLDSHSGGCSSGYSTFSSSVDASKKVASLSLLPSFTTGTVKEDQVHYLKY